LGCDSYWQDCASKCEVGKTCVPTDCSAYTLTSCPANATCTNCTVGCGDSTVKYKVTKCSLDYYLQNGVCTKIDGVIGLRYNVTAANGVVNLTTGKSGYASGNFTVDWGDGTVESYNGNTSVSHTYSGTGDFDVVLSGTIKHFATSTSTNANITHLLSLNLPSVLSYNSAFSSKTTIVSTIPALPTNLKDATLMFYGCSGLTGSIPKLPSTITDAMRMFDSCNHLTGTIPTLPSSLVDATEMFESCVSLSGTLNNTNLANTKIKYADSMFRHCRNLKGSIPALPQTLIEADRMFYNCNSLTGSIPALPTSIKTAGFMFYYCYSLTGNIPTLPPQLSTGSSMFENCTGLTGSIPSLPSTLKYGDWMFLGCTGLTGNIPTLPSVLYDARQMFSDCTGLTGNVPTLPKSLGKAENMFRDCNLSGTAPAKPSNLNSYTAMFRGTTVTNDGSWPDSAW
ncbi:MAG: leucine-rich repeat protein, partial [Alphaproteobacteria bacterium]|nr:leucine-rich repeat protein [Alphaproteobacteria bacterium]